MNCYFLLKNVLIFYFYWPERNLLLFLKSNLSYKSIIRGRRKRLMIGYRNYSQSDLRLFRAGAKASNINNHSVRNIQMISQVSSNSPINSIRLLNKQVQQNNQSRRSTSLTTKINFIFHQPPPFQKSISHNNKYPQSQSKKIQQIHNKKPDKQKPQKFMNIISKNYLSENVLNFIYGKDKTKDPEHVDHKLGPVVNSKQGEKRETFESQLISHGKVYDHLPLRRFNVLMSPTEQPTFQHFPISKVRRYGKSNRKSSENDLLFLSNGKNYNEQQNIITKNDQNQQNQVRETVNEQKKGQISQQRTEEQEWNNTIKFNQRRLNVDKNRQLGDTADSNAVNKSEGSGVGLKQQSEQSMRKNQSQRISEFIVCDQEMRIEDEENPFNQERVCHNFQIQNEEGEAVNKDNRNDDQPKELSNNQFVDEVPPMDIAKEQPHVQDIEHKDTVIQHNNDDSLMLLNTEQDIYLQQPQNKGEEKILYNIETSETLGCQKTQQIDHQTQSKFQLYDKLQESIQQLGKNIGDLSGRLCQLSQSRNQKQRSEQHQLEQVKQVGNKQRKLSLTSKCYSENVNKPTTNTSDIKKEGKINLELFPQDQKEDLKQFIVDDQIAINLIYQPPHHSHSKAFQFIQQEPVQSIQGQPSNELLNLTYSRETKIYHQKQTSQHESPNKPHSINYQKALGSLEIIDHKHQHEIIGHSLSNIYINQHPEKQPQKSTGRLVTTQCHYYSQKHYHHHLNIKNEQIGNDAQFNDANNRELQESTQSIPQEKVQQFLPHLTQNQFNKKQREKRIKEFYGVGAHTFQQPKSKKGIERVTKNIKGIQLGKSHNNTQSLANNVALRSQSKQIRTNNPGLNYEMYRTYRNRSGSKKYTLLGYDEKKERKIELPYMENPLNAKLNDQLIHLPKYIKSKVYYLKG